MKQEEIQKHREEINKLTQYEMGYMFRNTPLGHPYFERPLYMIFKARFEELGGFTHELSNEIGIGSL